MTRLLVHVEGQTEETFVNEVLRPHLFERGYTSVSARLVGNARLREKRGGIKPWGSVKSDIVRHLKGDPNCLSTSMVDYYALPATGAGAWPGRFAANAMAHDQKAPFIEAAIAADVAAELQTNPQALRFLPFVVMHEFEALLFSDCAAFARGIGRESLATDFQKIRNQFLTPEQINDSPITAPSKRVELLVPGYQKPFLGNLAASEVGLPRMRAECPNFAAWITKLEQLAQQRFI